MHPWGKTDFKIYQNTILFTDMEYMRHMAEQKSSKIAEAAKRMFNHSQNLQTGLGAFKTAIFKFSSNF
jgi:hypothetical protein